MSSDFYVKIYYHDGLINKVDDSTKESVKKAITKATKRIKNKELFQGLKVHVASDFSNLPLKGSELNAYLKENEDKFMSTKGITIDDIERKEIYIQESAFIPNKISNIFSFNPSFKANNEIEQATMHELGHQYNYIGGDQKLISEHQKLINKYLGKKDNEISLLPNEEKLLEKYKKNNEFSDKKEFKDALEKDLKNLDITWHIKQQFGYFIAEFYNRGLDTTPNQKDIDLAESSRSEIFAQLFSYAMGTDDGNKEDFIKLFPNTYNLVQKYINTQK